MLVLIDNVDSFTYNLADYLRTLGEEMTVVKANAISLSDLKALNPERLVISPGPGNPNQAGISLQAIAYFSDKIPILGVCLGHQAIAQHFGGTIVRADYPMHGKTSMIQHDGSPLFAGIDSPFSATRYHSLIVDEASLPAELQITAYTEEAGKRTIMALQHTSRPIFGVQFHPEAILSEGGHQLLGNFCKVST